MTRQPSRRQFLAKTSLSASTLGLTSFANISTTFENDPRFVGPDDLVQLQPDVEPLVRMIESTSREKCLEVVANQIKSGTSYRSLMAAVFLAGIRNIESASTGGPLHAVFVMHSAHQMSLDSAPDEQFLPMFWAVDNFKATQERGSRLDPMKPFFGKPVSPEKAISEFEKAMRDYDPDRAEAAMVSMIASVGQNQIVEQMWKWGARDYRAIGHKAIYLANGWRTIQTIGWRHAEPALRHLSRALNAYGTRSEISGYAMDDQCYAGNVNRAANNVRQLPENWVGSLEQPSLVTSILALIRSGNFDDTCDFITECLKSGTARSSKVWDAIHLATGEIVLRQASIRPIHSVTSANAIHYAFNQSSQPETRLYLLLQAAGWVCQFINFISKGGGSFPEKRIDQLAEVALGDNENQTVREIFDQLTVDADAAASMAFTLAQKNPEVPMAPEFLKVARSLVFRKGTDSHQYKFPAAAIENIGHISPRWRPHYLAATTRYLCGSREPDSPVMTRVRQVLS